MKNNIFDRFKPKENKFYPLLREMTEVIINASEIICDCVQSTSHEESVTLYKKIKEEELKGDVIQEQIFNELNNTFITPFDREDINGLSTRMDDVTDLINSCAKRIMLYNPKAIPESALRLAKLTNEAAKYLQLAVGELAVMRKSPEKIKEYCKKLKEIENRADDVYEHFLIDLFQNEKDAVEILKLKEILHELERATDAAESVGKIIKTIIIKYT